METDRESGVALPRDLQTLQDDGVESVRLSPAPGELIDGVYRTKALLGRGGHGTVMLAHDEMLDRRVALKFLHPSLTEFSTQRTRFLNEARAMARIRHPNVVGIHSVGQWSDSPYLVMEYLPGPTLQTYLADRGFDLSPDDAMGLFDQMCRGVAAIHEAGAIHNDLKPSNMIIGAGSRLGITDFGLAEWVRERGYRRGGTVGFIAPEIIRGDAPATTLRTAADIYSLGVLAFILFAGKTPFGECDSAEEVLDLQLGGQLAKPSEARRGIPMELDRPICQALAVNPAERPRHAEQFLAACVEAMLVRASIAAPARRILVIEDDVVMHPWLEASLHAVMPNARVECFASPVAALASVDRDPPHLVITDLSMPGMDGFAVVRELRERGHTRDVPIVAITGAGTRESWERLTTLGADGFLAKPFEPSTLRAVVRRMLSRAC
ncbi:Serine/threonine-protein kinase PK-1 [Enhygromyxa salina]|uniref:Serine/threonine-protein kinase PK-1 n=1 Tax=Enhygromyxa salina TaxID=215803 RepID=A0A2S9YB36_9BACT|nr:serine/threonine-protein kinase [Enhygromyxa salina]PRQ02313.1 Serine/threonine-protein kinase PK-1 [Enhygromyxa salina]